MEVKCNGAGEMPGQEGEGSYDDNYTAWIEKNSEYIVERWKEKIVEDVELDDVSDEFISDLYNKTMED